MGHQRGSRLATTEGQGGDGDVGREVQAVTRNALLNQELTRYLTGGVL